VVGRGRVEFEEGGLVALGDVQTIQQDHQK